jgi:hypothetical protein
MLSNEIWIPVLGFEDIYEVSDQGNVRSLDRVSVSEKRSSQIIKGRALKPRVNKNRNSQTTVCLWQNGKDFYIPISNIVLKAFVGMPEEGQEAAHNNGDATDNRLINLRWATHYDNIQDKTRHGTQPKGSKNGAAKLTEEDVSQIRSLYKRESYHDSNIKYLVQKFKVSRRTILGIVSGESWREQ